MKFDLRSRAFAALVHALGSLLVAAVAAWLVFGLWYPWPYTVLAGGTELFVLVISVDVVIGPLATFAIFDRTKGWPVLRRDLAVILALQLAALGYGLYVMFAARPVVLALETDRFRVVTAVEVVQDELPRAPAGLRRLPLGGPITLRTQIPDDPAEKIETAIAALSGVDLGMRPRYWRPWDDIARAETRKAGRSLELLHIRMPEDRERLDVAIARTGHAREQLRYLPVLSNHGEWVVLIDAGSGDVAGFAPLVGD